jgi:UDP-2,4-diacetamido-2,4,6-trideoxy-beta-L-altropyranose hydrolase
LPCRLQAFKLRKMQIVFRVDASFKIGTGHVMRCLTLAEELKNRGFACRFICRAHPGNMIGNIRQCGFSVHELPYEGFRKVDEATPQHAEWLGVNWQTDATQTQISLSQYQVDWLIVDHYGLDARWEISLSAYCKRLMVIDDLADRKHVCTLLLDQTFGRLPTEYVSLVPSSCEIICGSLYAMLRPEFAAWRKYSLNRRSIPHVGSILVSVGGVDNDNVTCRVLKNLNNSCLPPNCKITVVMGQKAPWLENVRLEAKSLRWPTCVVVGVNNMAQLMADCDLAIGAAGATSWERCCLGLPTILLTIAENQRTIAHALNYVGAAYQADVKTIGNSPLIKDEYLEPKSLKAMIAAAASITDGFGVVRVCDYLHKKV